MAIIKTKEFLDFLNWWHISIWLTSPATEF